VMLTWPLEHHLQLSMRCSSTSSED
jgi:hypothetical protein